MSMAFLIEGREMPKNCMSCYSNNTHVYIHMLIGCPYIKEAFHNYNLKKERHPDCPLIEVPEPHGRLGDLDKLEKMFADIDSAPYSGFDGEEPFYSAEDAVHIIRLAPTVIQATEEEKHE
jgi:hypothetical protein